MARWPGNSKRQQTSFGRLSRSQLMSRVKSAGNLTTELTLVRLLHEKRLPGWRRHSRCLGSPDFVWRGQKVAVFVDGCYWHGHDCDRNLSPKTNARTWQAKFRRNRNRDRVVTGKLRASGWSVVRIWECELKRAPMACLQRIRRALHASGAILSRSSR
jgi:DNA mismatch endonuclease (patch repair protein)